MLQLKSLLYVKESEWLAVVLQFSFYWFVVFYYTLLTCSCLTAACLAPSKIKIQPLISHFLHPLLSLSQHILKASIAITVHSSNVGCKPGFDMTERQ